MSDNAAGIDVDEQIDSPLTGSDTHPEDRTALRPGVKHAPAAGGDRNRPVDAVVALFAETAVATAIITIVAVAVIAAITLAVAVAVVIIVAVTAMMLVVLIAESDVQKDSSRFAGRHGPGLRPKREGDQGSTDKGQYLFHNVVYKVTDLNLS